MSSGLLNIAQLATSAKAVRVKSAHHPSHQMAVMQSIGVMNFDLTQAHSHLECSCNPQGVREHTDFKLRTWVRPASLHHDPSHNHIFIIKESVCYVALKLLQSVLVVCGAVDVHVPLVYTPAQQRRWDALSSCWQLPKNCSCKSHQHGHRSCQ